MGIIEATHLRQVCLRRLCRLFETGVMTRSVGTVIGHCLLPVRSQFFDACHKGRYRRWVVLEHCDFCLRLDLDVSNRRSLRRFEQLRAFEAFIHRHVPGTCNRVASTLKQHPLHSDV